MGLVGVGLLAGCGPPTTAVPVAPRADDPACAEAMAVLPATLGDAERHETTSQSTAAWGDPAVTWRCGLDPLGPTTDACYTIGGVDWVATDDDPDASTLFTTYGRDPVVQVRVPDAVQGRDVALAALAAGVEAFPQDRRCRSLSDVPGG